MSVHPKTTMVFVTAQKKRVINTIEVGELKTTIMLSCDGPKGSGRTDNEYNIYINYSFDYENKSGEIGGFAISRASKDSEQFLCDGIGENIHDTVAKLFAVDYPNASEKQNNDLVEVIDTLVRGMASENNWAFYGTDYDCAQAHENDG